MPIDRSLLPDYFAEKLKHPFYERARSMAEAFAPHSDGVYPEGLIDDRRPNEPLEVKDYRKKVWKPKTKPTFGRIISSLGKIRRSSDWSIAYPKTDFEAVVEGERLDDYCERNFPNGFKSITNWAFSLLLKKQLIDPNAVCVVSPLEFPEDETEYLKPYPILFNSSDVLDYATDDYVLLRNPSGAVYQTDSGPRSGKSFWYIDAQIIERWDQINYKGDVALAMDYVHGLDEAPFFKLGGVIVDSNGRSNLLASRIEDILPELDEAVREYSDLQAGKVLNMYPERWEFSSAECPKCNHSGFMPNVNWKEGEPDKLICDHPGCNGGYIGPSPYSKILVRPTDSSMNGQPSPIPPAGYIEKDIAILELMERSVAKHIYDGLSAINFQFLEQAPLNQSGTAKEVDKDELNNTVHAIAEDLVAALDNLYRIISLYRYAVVVGLDGAIEMLPSIPVPERFDILSANFLGEELDRAKKGGLNPAILNALEFEYASKKFNSNHNVADKLELVLSLDPLSNITEDNKISALSNKGIAQQSYVISSNIQSFVQRALEADEDFSNKPLPEQIKVMETFAKQLMDSINPAVAITTDVTDELVDPNAPEEIDGEV